MDDGTVEVKVRCGDAVVVVVGKYGVVCYRI